MGIIVVQNLEDLQGRRDQSLQSVFVGEAEVVSVDLDFLQPGEVEGLDSRICKNALIQSKVERLDLACETGNALGVADVVEQVPERGSTPNQVCTLELPDFANLDDVGGCDRVVREELENIADELGREFADRGSDAAVK